MTENLILESTPSPDAPMTVADLRAELANLPDDLPVVLSRDPEGNGFRPLWDVATGHWFAQDEEVADENDDRDGVLCVVLWP